MALSKPDRKPLQELNGKTGWCVEGMKKAIEAVVTQEKSLRQAAREYGVPPTTLKRRIDTSLPAEAKPGPSTVLSKEEEDRLVKYIITMAEMGFGLSPKDIRSLAYEIAESSGRNHPFTNKLAGKDWFQAFMRRYNISLRTPQPLPHARAKKANLEAVEEFFDRLSALYARLGLSPLRSITQMRQVCHVCTSHQKFVPNGARKLCGQSLLLRRDEQTPFLHVGLHLGKHCPP